VWNSDSAKRLPSEASSRYAAADERNARTEHKRRNKMKNGMYRSGEKVVQVHDNQVVELFSISGDGILSDKPWVQDRDGWNRMSEEQQQEVEAEYLEQVEQATSQLTNPFTMLEEYE